MHKLTDRIAREVETFYNTVGEVEGDLMANKVAPRIAVLRVRALGPRSRPRRRSIHWWKDQHTCR